MQPLFPNLRIAESAITFWKVLVQRQLQDEGQPGLFFVGIDPEGPNENDHEAEQVYGDYDWLVIKGFI